MFPYCPIEWQFKRSPPPSKPSKASYHVTLAGLPHSRTAFSTLALAYRSWGGILAGITPPRNDFLQLIFYYLTHMLSYADIGILSNLFSDILSGILFVVAFYLTSHRRLAMVQD